MKVIGYTALGSIHVQKDDLDMFVPDDMSNTDRMMVAEWEAEGNVIPPYVEPEVDTVTILYPADLWRRVTDEEADAIGEAMGTQPFRLRKIFETASQYRSDDELWPLLVNIAESLFGKSRASEILASSK